MSQRIPGFRLGIYVFKDAEIVDFAAPHGVFSVARRFDPELDAFLIADSARPGPGAGRLHRAAELQLLGPSGDGRLPHPRRLRHPAGDAQPPPARVRPRAARGHALTSVCTGSWIYGIMGLLDGLPATNRKEPDRVESGPNGKVPLDHLAEIAPACRVSRARHRRRAHHHRRRNRLGDGDGLHLLRRAGYADELIAEVARVMEYSTPGHLPRRRGGRGPGRGGA